MFKRILIANRGEIACRIIATAKKMGIETVAVYSEAEQTALPIKLADTAVCIGAGSAEKSYLNVDAIIQAALTSQAQAIHPGYGFLSESPLLAKACALNNITFIGPSVQVLETMGSKQKAKTLLEKTKIPLTPGYHGKNQSLSYLEKVAGQIGFPLLIKAASGGGGKGMRIVSEAKALAAAVTAAKREAKAYFGDDVLIMEKYVQEARHVEVQIIGDNFGNIYHLLERDCSIQRRHQKLIEEAPAPDLPISLMQKMHQAACKIAKKIKYVGVGTIEFLVTPAHEFYFMEMNTRLQVEHPVTEMILGLDLVEWQIRIASNEALPKTFSKLTPKGHAIECRLYAENPSLDFMAVSGKFQTISLPNADGVRIDTGYTENDMISIYYDALIAKIITCGTSREDAIQKMQYALKQYAIIGIPTNIGFIQSIITHPDFIKAKLSTNFLNQHQFNTPEAAPLPAKLFALAYEYKKAQYLPLVDKSCFAFHPFTPLTWSVVYQEFEAQMIPKTENTCDVRFENQLFSLSISTSGDTFEIIDNHQEYKARLFDKPPYLYCFYEGKLYTFEKKAVASTTHASNNAYISPMPGTIIAILKQKGEHIAAHEGVIVIEAMKMEHTICSANHGVLTEIFYTIGDKVAEGDALFTLKEANESST